VTDRTRGLLFALVGTLLWSTTGIFISYLLANFAIQPLTLAFWRDVFAGGTLVAVLAWRKPAALRLRRADLPFFLGYGFLGMAAFHGLWTYSVQFNGAAVATVLAYTAPAFTVLLARPLLAEPLTPRKLAATTLALGGCVLVAQAYRPEIWQVNRAGIVIGVVTGLLFALLSVGGRWSRGRFPSPWTVTTYGFVFAALGLGLTQNWHSLFSMGAAWLGWGVLFVLSIGPSLIGYGLYTVSLSYLPAGVAVIITALEPALTALLAIAILGERLDRWQWLGVLVVFLAVLLAQGEGAPVEGVPLVAATMPAETVSGPGQ
jgi:drug/metabolite transporter, DME family